MDDINSHLTSYENGLFLSGNIVATSGLFHSGITRGVLNLGKAAIPAHLSLESSEEAIQTELDPHASGPWGLPNDLLPTLMQLETRARNTNSLGEEVMSYDFTDPSYSSPFRSTSTRDFKSSEQFIDSDAENDDTFVAEVQMPDRRYQKMEWDVPSSSSNVRSGLIRTTQSPQKPILAFVPSSLEVHGGIKQFTEDGMPIVFLPISSDTDTGVATSVDVDTSVGHPSTQGASGGNEKKSVAEYSKSANDKIFKMLDRAGFTDTEAKKQGLKKEMRVCKGRLKVLQRAYDALDSTEEEFDDWLARAFEEDPDVGAA
ncbi:hypothetical protein EST38_g2094 [Candolleomyces aberdarensis]|uniref:Uncharacterized protein n=1 Tax=Candolleomyces aberdarensis TaxID=2316362 RepID=A0A4Q2DTD4_9AGAR|nr:hypothetical protein EST38_g2094 [Candolleomyces aberdarensis]